MPTIIITGETDLTTSSFLISTDQSSNGDTTALTGRELGIDINHLYNDQWTKLMLAVTKALLLSEKAIEFQDGSKYSPVMIDELAEGSTIDELWRKSIKSNYLYGGETIDLKEKYGKEWFSKPDNGYYLDNDIIRYVRKEVTSHDSVFGHDEYGPILYNSEFPEGLRVHDTLHHIEEFKNIGFRTIGQWQFNGKGELSISPENFEAIIESEYDNEEYLRLSYKPIIVLPENSASEILVSNIETASYLPLSLNELSDNGNWTFISHDSYQHNAGQFFQSLLNSVKEGDLTVFQIDPQRSDTCLLKTGLNAYRNEGGKEFEKEEAIHHLASRLFVGKPRDSIFGYDEYGPIYFDENGQYYQIIDSAYYSVPLKQLVGFRTLENWYIDIDKGAFSREVEALSPIYMRQGSDGLELFYPDAAILFNQSSRFGKKSARF